MRSSFQEPVAKASFTMSFLMCLLGYWYIPNTNAHSKPLLKWLESLHNRENAHVLAEDLNGASKDFE